MAHVLIVDNDEGLLHFLVRLFVKDGHDVASCTDGTAALQRVATEAFDLILLDYRMPGLDGLETLAEIKRLQVKTPVIVMTAHGTPETAIEAMKRGAHDYLLKPFDTQDLRRVAADAIQVHHLMREVVRVAGAGTRVTPDEARHAALVGTHRKMQEVFKSIGQVADKEVPVLLAGECGTGKELVARALYHHSLRRDQPFMAIDCARSPVRPFESELFGHERGAFAGADRGHLGKLERCHRGTLFLDEVGNLALGTQAKLLRVLQAGEFERLGGTEILHSDVRILAATSKDLQAEVEAGRFRRDLYYRLKSLTVVLPPLRERLEDVPALTKYFVARFAVEYDKPLHYVSDPALDRLRTYPWPGNVRELENCLRRAVLVCPGEVLLPEHLRFGSEADAEAGTLDDEVRLESLRRRIAALVPEILQLSGNRAHASLIDLVESALIAQALKDCGGNQVQTARMLGISRNTLRHRIHEFGLDGPG